MSRALHSRRWLAVLVLVSATLPFVPAQADPGDVGFMGPSYVGTEPDPTGEKPESKLWWNDGSWWASMWDTASADFHIFRLDIRSQTWVDTGVTLDPRPRTRADTLWDGSKLYVASHLYRKDTGPGAKANGRLWRFSYDPVRDTYTRDAGFPVAINQSKSETLTIEKDSTGQLWASWVQQTTSTSGVYRVYVTRTTGSDTTWAAPVELPVPGNDVAKDDISAVVSFSGRIGVMFSNQKASAMYFATRRDVDGDATWTESRTAIQGPRNADDHINLKSLQATSGGRVFAAIKTSMNTAAAPSIMLLARDPATGEWSSHVVWRVRENQTRPIVLIDTTAGILHVFASTEGGGSVFRKTSPLGAISFEDGAGTVVIRDADKPEMNNATSTKQNVSSTTGLVVLASNPWSSTDRRYWHHYDPLNGSTAPTNRAPIAGDDTYTTSQGTALSVAAPGVLANDSDPDGDALTAIKASDPGNGTVTLAANGSFTYTPASGFTGADSFTYRANDGSTSSALATVTINVTATGGGATVTARPTDDAYVRSSSPSSNAGEATTLRAYESSSSAVDSYLKFTVSGVPGSVVSAKLRLFVVDPSSHGGTVFRVLDNTWTEGTITWANRPPRDANLASAGAAATGTWVEFDVTSAVTGDGTYSFDVAGGTSDAVWYSSSEGSTPPELVVTGTG